MNPRVKLSDIIDSISFQTYNTVYYLDKENGKLFPVSKDQLRAAKENDASEDDSEWQNEQIKLARDILFDEKEEKYIAIPEKFVAHEYSTMENFCLSLKDQKISKPLCQAIFGGSAFNRFKNCIHRYGIADDWYRYRFNAMKKIIIDWCEANDIEYVEK
ncbi:MAG: hypothetical protein JRJ46_06530 [Deltaproteobacteria bacterium]|nr:hypothetical protein [Deltaproteobacteria bacterium]